MAIADTYGETCRVCPLAAGIDPDPDPDPAADDATTTPADKMPVLLRSKLLPTCQRSEGIGVADVAVGRERRLAAGNMQWYCTSVSVDLSRLP